MTTYKEHLKKVYNCPFCRKNSSEVIYEGMFHDVKVAIAPYKENHFLIIPHKHITSLIEYSKEMIAELTLLQQKFMQYMYDLGHKETILLLRDGNDHAGPKPLNSTTGKSLNHFHYHIIPDCYITSKELIEQSISDNRKILNEEEIVEIRNNREKRYSNN